MSELTGRKHTWRLMGAMTAYAIVLVASLLILDEDMDQPLRAIVALMPVVPVLYVVWVVVARFRALDEYWQQIQLTALPFAFLGSLLVAFTWGFAENAGLEPMNGFVMFGVMSALYLIGLWMARGRYS